MNRKKSKYLMVLFLVMTFMFYPQLVMADDLNETKIMEIKGNTSEKTDYEYYFRYNNKDLIVSYTEWADLSLYDEVVVTIDDIEINRHNGWDYDSEYSMLFSHEFLDGYEYGDYVLKIRAKRGNNDYYEEGSILIHIADINNLELGANEINLEFNSELDIYDVYLAINEVATNINVVNDGTVYINDELVNDTNIIIPKSMLTLLYTNQTEYLKTYNVKGSVKLEDIYNCQTYNANYSTTLIIRKTSLLKLYTIIPDNNGIYTINSNDSYNIYVSSMPFEIQSVLIDDNVINCYTIFEDKIIVSNDYMSSLDVGEHKVAINFLDGVGETILTIVPKQYNYLEGTNAVIIKDEDKSLNFRIDAELNKFITVYVNDEELDKKDYSLEEGSTIIIIDSKYLETLKSGKYKLKALFTDGEAITYFTIKDKDYNIINNDLSFEKGLGNDLIISFDEVGNIVSILINGKEISSDYYSTDNNNVIINNSLLETLSNDMHTITIKFTNGEITTNFNVTEKVFIDGLVNILSVRYLDNNNKKTMKLSSYKHNIANNDVTNNLVVSTNDNNYLDEEDNISGIISKEEMKEIEKKEKQKNYHTIFLVFTAYVLIVLIGFVIYKRRDIIKYFKKNFLKIN